MSDNRVIPAPAPTDRPTFTIKVDGGDIPPEFNVMSVVIQKTVNRIPTALVAVADGDAASQDFPASNSGDFVPGREIEILAGYHSDETTVFKGVITGQSLKVRRGKPALLLVECKDKAVKMTQVRKSAYFKDEKDSEVFEELLDAYGLAKDVEATSVQHKEMVQYHATDWDFLLTRAEANGRLVAVDDGKVAVRAPDTSQAAALSLAYGATLFELEAEMDARRQVPSAKSFAWDAAGQELLEEEGADPSLAEPGDLASTDLAGVMETEFVEQRHGGKVDAAELKAWSDARMLRSRLAKILGRLRCQGVAVIKPAQMVDLAGVGNRFNGKHFVSGVRHQIDARNWETDLQIGLSPRWFSCSEGIAEQPAGGLLPGVAGLQIGVVTALEGDPDGEHRVQVRLPVVSSDDDGAWARVATLDAGDGRGSFFLPELEDEVLVGFLNDDPRDPVILGMLNSSAKPAPMEAADDNHEKGFFTRSKMKLVFNDDKISFALETPNGNKLTVSDDEGSIVLEDENGNKIMMDADGITLDSAKDIILKAAGDVKVEGVNCEIKASAEMKMEGSSGTELTSSATTKVKGSLVQIN